MGTINRTLVRRALLAGLVAGTVDIGVACEIYHLSLGVILRSIASGLIGAAAFEGGAATALLGLLLQWAMSVLIAMIYGAATLLLPDMRRRWPLSGVIAGVVTYVVMSYLVVPLSASPFRPSLSLEGLFKGFTLHKFVVDLSAMILFGLIIAFIMRDVQPGIPSEESRRTLRDGSPEKDEP